MNSAYNVHVLVKRMSYSAILLALSVVLTRFASVPLFGWLRLGFGSIPIVLSSLIVGPIWGCLVGAGADLLGSFLFPQGAYFFGYTIDAALQGVLPWVTMFLLKGRRKYQTGVAVTLAMLMTGMAAAFVLIFSQYRKNDIPTWLRICIPFFFLIYFVAIFLLFVSIEKSKRISSPAREDRKAGLIDIYMICMVNECIISIGILGIWNQMLYNIPYIYSSFTQMLIFSINGLIRTAIIFLVVNALLSADKSFSLIPEKRIKKPLK